jgi:hypothetical protein
MKGRLGIAVLALGAALGTAPAGAVDQCKATIDKKTGEILVSAKGVVGTPLWGGGGVDDTANPFPDIVDCAGGGKLKKCHIGAPGTERARQPTSSCTLRVADDTNVCEARIAGCSASATLWARVSVDGDGASVYQGVGAVSAVEQGTGEVYVTFDRYTAWCAVSATLTSNAGEITAAQQGDHVRVLTWDSAGQSVKRSFDLVVHCP